MRRAIFSGLLAAGLFGAATPVCKLLLPGLGPFTLAGLLYVGAGAALLPVVLARAVRGRQRGSSLRLADGPFVLGMVFCGGVAGPVLLMVGLSRLSGVSTSLLLNLEAPLTMIVAIAFFSEHLTRREWLGALTVVGAAAVLSMLHSTPSLPSFWGALAVAGACGTWALDNNFAGRLSLKDPLSVVCIKALPAGCFNWLLGFVHDEPQPRMVTLILALVTGVLGYGLSIVLHLLALRRLGAARQAGLFATAPFAGALVALPLLGERPSAAVVFLGAVMASGVALLLSARHSHVHEHGFLEHEHLHVHDEHHQHTHDGPVTEPHSHWHRHVALVHDHPHVSDAHHLHRH